jgi:hypothetical protein
LKRLHNHAFYLYSAIVGLAIREALVNAGKHIFIPLAPALPNVPAPVNLAPWQVHLEAFRLVLFLFTISSFYVGAGVYFDKVHVNPAKPEENLKKSYGLDFGMGLIHFLIFFAWAMAITDHTRFAGGVSPFLLYLSAIFLYDMVWLVVSFHLDSMQEIKLWALVCFFFWAVATGVFFAIRGWKGDVFAEEICFFIFVLYLCGDIIELFSGKPFFLKWILRALPKNVAEKIG